MSGSISPVYALSLLGVALYWLWQVAGFARRSQWPRLGFLMPLGLASLLAAPESALDVPALFGMGLGFALIAAYFPLTKLRHLPQGRDWTVAVFTLLLAFEGLSSAVTEKNLYWLMLGIAALLYGLALLISVWLYPRRSHVLQVTPAASPAERQRWQSTLSADPPDLELTLEAQQARILNNSPYAVQVLGWSPARQNTWLPLRQSSGEVSANLASGQTGYLMGWEPMSSNSGGLRLWYTRAGTEGVFLFRADWEAGTPQNGAHEERVLN